MPRSLRVGLALSLLTGLLSTLALGLSSAPAFGQQILVPAVGPYSVIAAGNPAITGVNPILDNELDNGPVPLGTEMAAETEEPSFPPPTGTISSFTCGPFTTEPTIYPSCSSDPIGSATLIPWDNALDGFNPGASVAISPSFSAPQTGWWCFGASYSGDSNYLGGLISPPETDAMHACYEVSTSAGTLPGGSPISITGSAPAGVVGQSYSTPLTANGGNPPYKWSLAKAPKASHLNGAASMALDKLPKGLHLNKSTGVISGTPNKKDSGTYTVTVTVVDTKVKVKHQKPTQNGGATVLSITVL